MSNHKTPEQIRVASFQLSVLRKIVLALVLLCISFLTMALLSSCAMTFPLGSEGKYGAVRVDVNYLPPIDLFQAPPKFLTDK